MNHSFARNNFLPASYIVYNCLYKLSQSFLALYATGWVCIFSACKLVNCEMPQDYGEMWSWVQVENDLSIWEAKNHRRGKNLGKALVLRNGTWIQVKQR
jgi:hypothetical protein